MKGILLALLVYGFTWSATAQTIHPVCISEVFSTGACNSTTGIFTPGNLTIQQGDQIQFTTYMVALGGYNGTHDIQFAGSPANNVMLPISTNVLAPVTTVTTPPFNTPGTFSMECHDPNHCVIANTMEGWPCNTYSVTVLSNCTLTANFTASDTNVCTGDIVNFTNTSSGATSYEWHLDEFTFTTTTDAILSFGTSGSYDIELIADDGAGCLDSTTITINVDQASNAGVDDSQIFCNTNDSVDLNTLITGDTTGFWEETTSSGQFNDSTGVFNYYGLSQQDYLFNYVVPGTGACPNDTAIMTITVNQEPNLTLILSGSNIELSDSVFIDYTTSGVLGTATFLWDFCDGNLDNGTTPFYYSWDATGNYCVCVQVNNGNGCLETFCDSTITVFDASGLSVNNDLVFGVYPNPAKGDFIVDLSGIEGSLELSLINVNGKVLIIETLTGGTHHAMNSQLSSNGTYYIIIKQGDKISTLPLVINQ